jgi:hypothetical protein
LKALSNSKVIISLRYLNIIATNVSKQGIISIINSNTVYFMETFKFDNKILTVEDYVINFAKKCKNLTYINLKKL